MAQLYMCIHTHIKHENNGPDVHIHAHTHTHVHSNQIWAGYSHCYICTGQLLSLFFVVIVVIHKSQLLQEISVCQEICQR